MRTGARFPSGGRPHATASQPGEAVRIGGLEVDHVEPVARLLARAFRDTPLNCSVMPGASPARRLEKNLHGMRSSLLSALQHGEAYVALLGGKPAGALLAVPPGAYPMPAPGWTRQLRCLVGQGWRVATRWGVVFDLLHGHHPRVPHAYLGTLGVEPAFWGRGVGRALLAHWLARIDRAGSPAYLETDSERNLAFYARAGFEPVGEVEVFGAPIWRMRRPVVAAISERASPQ